MFLLKDKHSDAGEAQTRGPSVSSQALYHWATALPNFTHIQFPYLDLCLSGHNVFDSMVKVFKSAYEYMQQRQ